MTPNTARLTRQLLTPARILVFGYAGVIFAGTLLLMLPVSVAPGRSHGVVEALFTATSAVTVTGLVVVDSATHWSSFGQVVILLLIETGGLGFMTMSTLIALLLGKRIGLRERIVMQEALGQFSLGGLVRLTRYILGITFALQLAGALLLALRWTRQFPWGRSAFLGLFHAVSAFNNAGFDLFGTSLEAYVSDLTVNLTVMALIITGGLGFSVLLDIYNTVRERRLGQNGRLSLHSKLVLILTGVLIIVGAVTVFTIERSNPRTMQPLSMQGKVLASLFHAVTPRTAGFNTLRTGDLRPATLFLTILLMFIGASPGGTGGGIKTTTFGTVMAAVWATVTGKAEVVLFERRLGREIIDRSLAIAVISLLLVALVTMILLIVEGTGLLPTLFEATSAFGTVGLSTGLTPQLSTLGRLLVAFTMFTGRVGPLTLALAIAYQQKRHSSVRHPEEKIMVG